jgi:hypothetical protein
MARRELARYSGDYAFLTREDEKIMPTRKKNAIQPRQGKCKTCSEAPPHRAGGAAAPDIETMLMVGTEHVVIHSEEDDNIDFMAELIDP